MGYGSHAYRFHEGNLLTRVKNRGILAWQPERCLSNSNILWWGMTQGFSPSLNPLGYRDLDGAIYTPQGARKGLPVFFTTPCQVK